MPSARNQFSKFAYLKSLHGVQMQPNYYRVLVTLLDYARADGTNAHPGNDRLAAACRCSADTVKRALMWAKDQGLIVMVKQGRNNAGATIWRFPQRGTDAPLSKNRSSASVPVSPGSQGGTGAPPSEKEQGWGSADHPCAECGLPDDRHMSFCTIAPPF
ncbi:helix-turn-helix domain-containing protein [Mycobacterium sp. pW049]|uniref:helix-turn-helix domain-containing protein n=1 Tax=[Mycobacterium] bulgaricum TaxID=3238985 RepID=UPI0035A8EDD4